MTDHDPRYRQAIDRFQELFEEACSVGLGDLGEPAMTLATADANGRPSIRTVLLKHVDERGFVFYTNRNSRKGRALRNNPRAALLFLWPALRRQVNIEGEVAVVDDSESDAYWAGRPRESQLGAWASQQSEPLASRQDYEERLETLRQEYHDRDVPRPPHWCGFRVVPDRVEFWHEGQFRQHERDCYWRDAHGWHWTLLYP